MSAEVEVREEALVHLFNSVLHQTTMYTAAAPVAELGARMLEDPRFDGLDGRYGKSMREELLNFLGYVAQYATDAQIHPELAIFVSHDDLELPFMEIFGAATHIEDAVCAGRLGAGCAHRAASVISTLMPRLDSRNVGERDAALNAIACWAALPGGARPVSPPALEQLRGGASDRTRETWVRIGCVLGLVGAGADTGDLLADDSDIVRICAALSPTVAIDPRTAAMIGAALADPGECDSWIQEIAPVPFLAGPLSVLLAEVHGRRHGAT